MRQVVSILLLSVYLLAYTDVSEIFFLPTLVEHYNDHKQRTPDLSVADFLVNHYFAGSTDKDVTEHADLPFTHLHGKIPATNSPSFFAVEIADVEAKIIDGLPEYFDPVTPNQFLCSIWQPPRATFS